MNVYYIIGIVASLIIGAFLGRIACNLMNRNEFTIYPIICTIVGLVGGGLGGWLGKVFPFSQDPIITLLIQLAFGIGVAIFLLVFLYFVRGKNEDPLDRENFQE